MSSRQYSDPFRYEARSYINAQGETWWQLYDVILGYASVTTTDAAFVTERVEVLNAEYIADGKTIRFYP